MVKETDLGKERLRDVPNRARLNAWGPLKGAGIRVTRISKDFREVDIEMKLTRKNRNYVGTHYGGSLYSMTDPFYMLMLMEHLGRDYIVWDKSANIRFRRPGRGRVRAEFRISDEQLSSIREQLQTIEKVEPTFTVEVKDEAGEVVAVVEKVVQVRKKQG